MTAAHAALFRTLAARLANRYAAPSLEGYELADGLLAAADMLEGKPGPLVHADIEPNTSGSLAELPRVTLDAYAGGDESGQLVMDYPNLAGR